MELKTLNYISCFPVYELRFLTQFPQIVMIFIVQDLGYLMPVSNAPVTLGYNN